MSNKVFVYGRFHFDDIKYIVQKEDLKIVNHLSSPIDTVDDFLDVALHSDLVIFPWEGYNFHQYFQKNINNTRFRDFFSNPSIKKAYWSMDSHHQFHVEKMYQQFFDSYYIAHAAYIKKYDSVPARWLPCYYDLSSIDKLMQDATRQVPYQYDICCIFRSYAHIGDRNYTVYEIEKKLKKLGLKYFFGSVDNQEATWERYIGIMKSSKIILNVSIMDDFNLRNFEAWGLNKTLLANKTIDHEMILADFSHTYLFDKNLSDFDEKLASAMIDQENVINSSLCVLNNHMKIHRYIDIINNELGTNYSMVDMTELYQKNKSNENMGQPIFVSSEKGDVVYNNSPEFALKAILVLVNTNYYDKAIGEVQAIFIEYSYEAMKNTQCHIVLFSILQKSFTDFFQQKSYQILAFIHIIMDRINNTISLQHTPQQYITMYMQVVAAVSAQNDLLLIKQAKDALQNVCLQKINILLSNNQVQEAIKEIEQGLQIDATNSQLLWVRITALSRAGLLEESVEAALKYSEMFPQAHAQSDQIKEFMERHFKPVVKKYLEQQKYEQAIAVINFMLSVNPPNPVLYAMNGYCYRLLGDDSAANAADLEFLKKIFTKVQ